MSVAPRHHAGAWTFDDLDQLPDDGWRHEAVDGPAHVRVMPPPGR